MGKLRTGMREFINAESGAVTTDWTVLTASVVGLGLAVALAVAPGATRLAGQLTSFVPEPGIGDIAETDGKVDLVPDTAAADEKDVSEKESDEPKRDGDYAYNPYSFNAEELDGIVKEAAANARQNLSEKEITAAYHDSVRAFDDAMARGASRDAAYALDKLHIWERTLAEVGVDLPKDAPTVQDLDQKYRATIDQSDAPQTLLRSQRR